MNSLNFPYSRRTIVPNHDNQGAPLPPTSARAPNRDTLMSTEEREPTPFFLQQHLPAQHNAGQKRPRTAYSSDIGTSNETAYKRPRIEVQLRNPPPLNKASATHNATSNSPPPGNAVLHNLIEYLIEATSQYGCTSALVVNSSLAANITQCFMEAIEANHTAKEHAHQISPEQLRLLASCLSKLREVEAPLLFNNFFYEWDNFLRTDRTAPELTANDVCFLIASFHNMKPSEGAVRLLETLVMLINECKQPISSTAVCTALGGMHFFSNSPVAYDLLDALWNKVTSLKQDNNVAKPGVSSMGLFGLQNFSYEDGKHVDFFRSYLISSLLISDKIYIKQFKNIFDHIQNASSGLIQVAFEKLERITLTMPIEELNEKELIRIFYMLHHCQKSASIESTLNHFTPQIIAILQSQNTSNWQPLRILAALEKLGSLDAAQHLLQRAIPHLAGMQWVAKHNLEELMWGFSSFLNNPLTEQALIALSNMIKNNNFGVNDVKKSITILAHRPNSIGKEAVLNALLAKWKPA